MKLIYLLFIILWQVASPAVSSSVDEVGIEEHISNLGLHVNHYREFFQTPLIEVVEGGSEEHSRQSSHGVATSISNYGFYPLPVFIHPPLNLVHLQRVRLPLYRLHGNFRL